MTFHPFLNVLTFCFTYLALYFASANVSVVQLLHTHVTKVTHCSSGSHVYLLNTYRYGFINKGEERNTKNDCDKKGSHPLFIAMISACKFA